MFPNKLQYRKYVCLKLWHSIVYCSIPVMFFRVHVLTMLELCHLRSDHTSKTKAAYLPSTTESKLPNRSNPASKSPIASDLDFNSIIPTPLFGIFVLKKVMNPCGSLGRYFCWGASAPLCPASGEERRGMTAETAWRHHTDVKYLFCAHLCVDISAYCH